MKARKTYDKILAGSRNIRFDDLCQLAKAFGFALDPLPAAITSSATRTA